MIFDEIYKDFENGVIKKEFGWYIKQPYLERLDFGDGIFKPVLTECFSNWHWLIRRRFNKVINSRGDIKAIYTEINGFYINPYNWGYHVDGHASDQGTINLEWLSRPVCWSRRYGLSGFYNTNYGYYRFEKNEMWSDENVIKARDLANLIVCTAYIQFIHNVFMVSRLSVPIYVGIHDFDLAVKV